MRLTGYLVNSARAWVGGLGVYARKLRSDLTAFDDGENAF